MIDRRIQHPGQRPNATCATCYVEGACQASVMKVKLILKRCDWGSQLRKHHKMRTFDFLSLFLGCRSRPLNMSPFVRAVDFKAQGLPTTAS